ncbi:MAG TPA: hypothetical protein PKK23_14640 [Nitrospirales bacterium]|nr:DUF2703 domain-containing protein [Nitrospiraceae bacterium]HNP30281.1 hypothetical protein [Nitrospirales bacterium]
MKIEVFYFDGCPSYPKAVEQVKKVLKEEGIDLSIDSVPVETHKDALTHRFLGSPTIRVNGLDVEVQARAREDFGLKCRLYRTGGNLVGIPDTNLIKESIKDYLKEL